MTDTHTTSHIPDEAVQAAAKRSYEYEGDRKGLLYVGFENEPEDTQEQWRNSVKEAILGALPHLAPCAVELKKLEWFDQAAETPFGDCTIQYDEDEEMHETPYCAGSPNDNIGHFETEEEAKAAAQADFERRVLSCVVTKPVDVAALLNSAALIVEGRCTAINNEFIQKLSKRNVYELAALVADHDIKLGAAIRTLSAEPAQGARTLEEWHEDHGNVVWWAWDNDRKGWLGEPAYIGKPLDSDWPDYHTHWTPHPPFPAAPTTEAGK